MIIEVFFLAAGAYLFCGLAFAIPFVLKGAGKIDAHAQNGSRGFRVLIVPGAVFLWPLLASRWSRGIHEPPEEDNPHRRTADSARCSRGHEDLISYTAPRTPGSATDQSFLTSAVAGEGKGSKP